MSDNAKKLQELIAKKAKNIVPMEKCEDLLTLIRTHYGSISFTEALNKLESYSELPTWLNDALTINETFFFRHPQHFTSLEQYFSENKDRAIKILCCGVSSGEEAYSIAMIAADKGHKDFQIFGIDLSQSAINEASQAIYPEGEVQRCPAQYKKILEKYIKQLCQTQKGQWQVCEEIKQHVRFKQANVFNIPLENYDVIFVRNILIYFSEAERSELLTKLSGRLNQGGYLYIGTGEIFPTFDKRIFKKNESSVLKKVA